MKIFGFNISRAKKSTVSEQKGGTKDKKNIVPPSGRVSAPPSPSGSVYNDNVLVDINDQLKLIKPDKLLEYIPVIRKLYKVNEDVGSVLYDAIQLTNTGHDIYFDESIPRATQIKMRKHLQTVSKDWNFGTAGITGLINKLIAQIYVSGALSAEWIVKNDLTGLDGCALVNPETIVFGVENKYKYIPYQKNSLLYGLKKDYIRLNTNSYRYMGLYSDEDQPYGVPPFLTAVSAIKTQKDMKANIDHILNQLGLLGYLEVKLDKPGQMPNESETVYRSRLENLLSESKSNILRGFKEGVVVGFQDDHEFDFHSTTKNLQGVSDLFNMNENQVANGLKTSAAFLGVSSPGTDSFGTVVFTKMISQLSNVQEIISNFISMGYRLELICAGYDVDQVYVEFKPSTITDDVKIQQGREYKQRTLKALWLDGIISQEIYALEMGYDKPDRKVNPDKLIKDSNKGSAEDKDKNTKNKSARKSRDTTNPQPPRKDQDTKPR